MAKAGFKVLDSDMHVMEPPDLWQRYIDPAFRDRAPVFKGDPMSHGFANRWQVEGKVFPAHSETKARTQSLAGRHEHISDRFAEARAQQRMLRVRGARGVPTSARRGYCRATIGRPRQAHRLALPGPRRIRRGTLAAH